MDNIGEQIEKTLRVANAQRWVVIAAAKIANHGIHDYGAVPKDEVIELRAALRNLNEVEKALVESFGEDREEDHPTGYCLACDMEIFGKSEECPNCGRKVEMG